MKAYYIFDDQTGEIRFTGITAQAKTPRAGLSFRFHSEKVDSTQNYHDLVADELSPRPELLCSVSKNEIIADGNDSVTISDLPNPTIVTWPDGQVDEVTDGEVIFKVDLIGFHEFIFESFPYKTKYITIEAV